MLFACLLAGGAVSYDSECEAVPKIVTALETVRSHMLSSQMLLNVPDINAMNKTDVFPYSTCQKGMFILHTVDYLYLNVPQRCTLGTISFSWNIMSTFYISFKDFLVTTRILDTIKLFLSWW